MSYNREWDRGKDTASGWTDSQASSGNAWHRQHQESRGNIRPRDDDYYGQDKRRKFNNGGYDNPHHDSSYDGSDRGGSGAGGSFSGKKRLQASEPSPHVIFLGLEPDFTESDLQAFLSSYGCSVETVTIIRERSTGLSKGFGFAQFPTTEHAKAFVDPLFPFVQIPPPASHGATAQAAFYKALETGAPHNGRRVKIDYSQSASSHDRRPARNQNDGTRDIGNAPAAVLLFRGLDSMSGPQAIFQAMKTSAGPGKDGAKGMKRIILIKDKSTLASFCFGFVEFIDIPSASAVLGDTMSSALHPNGFRISDKPVATSFANPHSFQPVADIMLRDEACITSSVALGGVEGTFVRYWDESSTVAVLEFKVEPPAQSASGVKDRKEKKKQKVPATAEPEPALIPIALAPSTMPVSDKPLSLSLNKGIKSSLGSAKPLQPIGVSLEDNEEEEVVHEPNKPHVVSKVGPMMGSKKIAGNINKWNQAQEKLTSTVPTSQPRQPKSTPTTDVAPRAIPKETPMVVESDFEFSDTQAMTCLLCSRKFNTLDVLKRHNKESDLHKKNMQDSALCEAARTKVAAARQQQEGGSKEPKYRDRASERRTLFNQPDVPLPTAGGNGQAGRGNPKGATSSGLTRPPSPPPPVNPGQDQNNVGNKLLKMMGWTEGTGLGQGGEGRVDPIETAIYAQGAGLGASKGKEVGKYASGSYVSKAQDTARERFNSS